MPGRVPVLGQHHTLEVTAELVEQRHDLVAARSLGVCGGGVFGVGEEEGIAGVGREFFQEERFVEDEVA